MHIAYKMEQKNQLPFIPLSFLFPVVPGPVLSLSTQCTRDCEQVKVLALCAGQDCKKDCGSLLTVLTLPTKDIAGTGLIEKIRY